ncbi:F0F1 ATP synthase subunit delta [Mesoplasma photuris]|uniref:F0F1 ATP synthase subunit delta n=1 Tax=Mesoplasma photuris TaxID=217731 RepID=UPI0004E1A341|nr:F0F1 ATP synthase subunit delta [Mesoplasma photuris]
MILNKSVIDNWARALANIAVKTKKVEPFLEQSHALVEALKDKDDFVKILTIKSSHDEAKRVAIIDETFKDFGFDIHILNAMKLMVETQTFVNARPIFKQLRKNLLILNETTYGVIWSSIEIDTKQVELIQEKISKKLNKKIILVNKIDEKVIGGVKVIVENHVFDGSIKGKLEQMKYETLKNK